MSQLAVEDSNPISPIDQSVFTEEAIQVLLVEDDPNDAFIVREFLEGSAIDGAYEICQVGTIADAFQHLDEAQVDIVLLDLSLPDACGLNGVEQLCAFSSHPPVVVLTGQANERLATESLNRGAQDYLLKDRIDSQTLSRSLRYALERHQLYEGQKKRIREMRCQEVQLRALINQHSDGILLADEKEKIQFVNPAAEDLFGERAEALIGGLIDFPLALNKTIEVYITRSNGDLIPVEIQTRLIGWEGKPAYLATLARFERAQTAGGGADQARAHPGAKGDGRWHLPLISTIS